MLSNVPVRFTAPPEWLNEPSDDTLNEPPRFTVAFVAVNVPALLQASLPLPSVSVPPVAVIELPAELLHVPPRLTVALVAVIESVLVQLPETVNDEPEGTANAESSVYVPSSDRLLLPPSRIVPMLPVSP